MSGLKLATVANAIEGLSISGVTVKDIDNIPAAATERDCFLFPKPDGWLSSLTVTPRSQGTIATGQKVDVSYTLTYTLAFGNFGTGRSKQISFYANMVAKAVLVINAIIENGTVAGAVDITPSGVTSFGLVNDPAGNPHPGTYLTFDVLEFYEV